jgi:hypothetical protein
MYIAVEPYLYDTSQVKYISSVLLHSNVYVLSCLFSRNLSVSVKRREAENARIFNQLKKLILPSMIRGFKNPGTAGLVAGI